MGHLVTTLESAKQSLLLMGPAASQIAIKQLGSNGGGFFGINSAHPFENPTALSNFLQVLAIVIIPMACPLTFGDLIGSKKHGWLLFGVMLALLGAAQTPSYWSESQGNPLIGGLAFLEGKELRLGTGQSVLWSVFTTATSNGSVNAMHSRLSPLSGGLALLKMMLGEVVFGGVGSAVYGIFLFSVLTVFIAGLMVGRRHEFLGRKMEADEIKLAVIGVLLPSVFVPGFSAIACLTLAGLSSLSHQGPHGLSEIVHLTLETVRNELNQHKLQLNIPESTPPVCCDIGLTQNALKNILSNAAIYTPPGTQIILEAATTPQSQSLCVRDFGPGLPSENVHCVFEKFLRANPSKTGQNGFDQSSGVCDGSGSSVDQYRIRCTSIFCRARGTGSHAWSNSQSSLGAERATADSIFAGVREASSAEKRGTSAPGEAHSHMA